MSLFVEQIPDALMAHDGRELKATPNDKYGFYQLEPLPSDAELEQIYKEQFAAQLRPHFLEKKKQDRGFWRYAHHRKHELVSRELGDLQYSPSVLDIGCGVGQLLEDFRDWGWQVKGVEPADVFQEVLKDKDIPVYQGMFGDLSEQELESLGQYDFVNLTNVLEHVRDPLGMVSDAVSLVKPGGILCIETPNDFNDLQLIAADKLQSQPWWLHGLHLNYFDRKSLQKILQDYAMDCVSSQAQFPLEFFLLAGVNYIDNPDQGRSAHQMRVQFETAMHEAGRSDLLSSFYEAMANLGIGRSIAVFGRK